MKRVARRSSPATLPVRAGGRHSRLFRGGDIRETLFYFLSALVVRSLPEPTWPTIADTFSKWSSGSAARRYDRFRDGVRAVLGDEVDEAEIAGLYARALVHRHRRRLCVTALRRRREWNPSIELIGLERLEQALAGQHGAILWFDNFTHFSIIGKRAFAKAGYALWHLSSRDHGFSATRYGVRFLNPRQIGLELSYLAGRIAFTNRSVITATRRLVEILADNGIMSITNNANIGKSTTIPFGKSGRLSIATAPFNLATSRGVALLPVSVIEVEPLARYRVTIGPEIVGTVTGSERDTQLAMEAEYGNYLMPLVRAYPDQWLGWRAAGSTIGRDRDAEQGAP